MYKALHMLVGTYVKDMDAENTYDYVYEIADVTTEAKTTNKAPREARRPPQPGNHRGYYADEVLSAGVGLGARPGSSGGITNVEFYSLLCVKAVSTGIARTQAGAGNAEVEIESVYVDEVVEQAAVGDDDGPKFNNQGIQIYNPNDVIRVNTSAPSRLRATGENARVDVVSFYGAVTKLSLQAT